MTVPITGAIRAGDRITLGVWLRAIQPTQAKANLFLSSRTDPARPAAIGLIVDNAGPGWARHQVVGLALDDLADGDAQLVVHLATQAQELEIGPAFLKVQPSRPSRARETKVAPATR